MGNNSSKFNRLKEYNGKLRLTQKHRKNGTKRVQEGTFDDNRKLHGTECELTTFEGNVYSGNFKHGQLNGNGSIQYVHGQTDTGVFLDNELHGLGVRETKRFKLQGTFAYGQFIEGKIMDKEDQIFYKGTFDPKTLKLHGAGLIKEHYTSFVQKGDFVQGALRKGILEFDRHHDIFIHTTHEGTFYQPKQSCPFDYPCLKEGKITLVSPITKQRFEQIGRFDRKGRLHGSNCSLTFTEDGSLIHISGGFRHEQMDKLIHIRFGSGENKCDIFHGWFQKGVLVDGHFETFNNYIIQEWCSTKLLFWIYSKNPRLYQYFSFIFDKQMSGKLFVHLTQNDTHFRGKPLDSTSLRMLLTLRDEILQVN